MENTKPFKKSKVYFEDKKTYEIDGSTLSFRAELNKKLNIKDDDVTLSRREYRYTVNAIQRRT
jgi:GH43 family beta-xylosidase